MLPYYLVFGLKSDFQKWPNLVLISRKKGNKNKTFFSVSFFFLYVQGELFSGLER